jgi:hypothetical protein
MLVTFKSKAAADVVMYEEHAKRILDLLGKDVARGVITAEESGAAIAALDAEFARSKFQSAAEEVRHDAQAALGEDEDAEHGRTVPVPLSTRMYPLLEMLRAAQKTGQFVAWGV